MIYEIMHRENCVAQISTVGECKIYLEDFMPYDLMLEESNDFDKRIKNAMSFYSWCASRMIPPDRTYAKEILNSIGASQSVTDRERAQIALSYHCLSLLDVFWVKEENEKIRFEDINLFAHSLSNALVDIALRGHQMTVTNAHLLANDLSTGGLYPKAWVRKEDGFYLYKDGGRDAVEREVLASKICRCFDCHQVLYCLLYTSRHEISLYADVPAEIEKNIGHDSREVYFCLSIIIFAKGKGSSARTFVRGRTPFLIRSVNHKRCLCIKGTWNMCKKCSAYSSNMKAVFHSWAL